MPAISLSRPMKCISLALWLSATVVSAGFYPTRKTIDLVLCNFEKPVFPKKPYLAEDHDMDLEILFTRKSKAIDTICVVMENATRSGMEKS